MKRFTILSTICLVLWGCSISEKPQFIGIKNIKVLESNSKHISFTANALFTNPNDIGGKLKSDAITVFINDNEMATISSEDFNVPAKKQFSIPLKANVPTDSIFNNKSLGGLISGLFSKKIKIQYKGDIKYTSFGFSYTYDIDKTEDIKIKL